MKVEIPSYFKTQSKLFQDNKSEIEKNNIKLLQAGLTCCCLIFAVLFLAGIFLPCHEYTALPCLGVLLLLSALSAAFRFRRVQRFVCVFFYLASAILFVFAVYAGLIADTQYHTAVLTGLYGLIPLIILDKSWKVNIFVSASCLIYIMMAFLLNEPWLALQDSVYCTYFAASGIFMGEVMRSVRLDNIELKRQAQFKMETDFLTGLFNRRKLYEVIQKEAQQINAVMMVDIDHFKRYNDCYGHPAGDVCLQKIGILLKEFGQSECVFRYGGEEFVILTRITDSSEVQGIAEMLRKKVWDLEIAFPQYKEGRLTLSVGFAVRETGGKDTPEQLIAKADKALYCAKSGGRNKVSCYSELPEALCAGKTK